MVRRIFHIITLLLFAHCICLAQFFSIVDDLGGPTGQSQHKVVIPLDSTIIVLGDYTDSTVSFIWPIIVEYDYEGNRLSSTHLVEYDTSQLREIDMVVKVPQLINDSTAYFITQIVSDDGNNYDRLFWEIDIKNKRIVREKYFEHENFGFGLSSFASNSDSSFVLSFYEDRPNFNRGIRIVELDSALEITKNYFYDTPDSLFQYPTYIQQDKNGNFDIIISSTIRTGTNSGFSSISLLEIDNSGTILNFKPRVYNEFLGLSQYFIEEHPVVRLPNEEWIIATSIKKKNILNVFPIIFSMTASFDSILWHKDFTHLHDYEDPLQFINRLCLSHDKKSVLFTMDQFSNSIEDPFIAIKTSVNGDSIWSKRFFISDIDKENVYFIDANYATASPQNGFLISGAFSDKEQSRYRSFLMHIDEDGCIIPGCNEMTNTTDDKPESKFSIYPNPATDVVYVLNTGLQGNHQIRLISEIGAVIKQEARILKKEDQIIYMLPSNITNGQYFLQFQSEESGAIYSQGFVVVR